MFKINLVPEVQKEKQRLSRLNYITTLTVSIVLGVTVAALIFLGGLIVYNRTALSGVENAISDTNAELAQYKELEETVLSLENGLAGAKQILDGNNAWTKLLPHLEAATPKDVKYTKLALEPGKITATLKGKDVNSLARFAESYKKYSLVKISGPGNWGEEVKVFIDNGSVKSIPVKSDGTWNYATSMDPEKDHEIVVEDGSGNQMKMSYSAQTRAVVSGETSVQVTATTLFSSVEISKYSKEGNEVTFDAELSFDGALLW